MKTIFDDKGKDIYILYMFLSCDFFENGWICMYMYIYLYVYIEIGKKQRDYTFIPTSLFRDHSLIRGFYKYPLMSEWSRNRLVWMKVVSLFFLSLNIYRALLLRIEHCTAENRNTDFQYIYIIIIF